MQKLVIPTLSLSLLAAGLSAQAVITAAVPNNNPNLGPNVINQDAQSPPNTIAAIEQFELRHIGGGLYRTVVTAVFTGGVDSSLVSGTINYNTNPPTWTPNNDVFALNTTAGATDEFQGSMSADGLVIVWDNYQGTSYPNTVNTTSFVCRRASTSVAFNPNDVRAIVGVAAGGVDPHIGEELPNGNVVLYYIDFNGFGDIFKGELDPATGILSNTSIAGAMRASPTSQGQSLLFAHSPFAQRDSTGKARALTYSEASLSSGQHSDALWRPGVNNNLEPTSPASTTAKVIAQGFPTATQGATWYANPSVNGGTWNFATAQAGYGDPTMVEACAVANTDVSTGTGRIVAFAPISPYNPARVFISAVGIGSTAPGYNVPPVADPITIFPTVGLTPIVFHDARTGLAEWVFNIPGTGFGGPYTIQLITLDGANSTFRAGNNATLIVP